MKSVIYYCLAFVVLVCNFVLSSYDAKESNKQSGVLKKPIVEYIAEHPVIYRMTHTPEETTKTDTTTTEARTESETMPETSSVEETTIAAKQSTEYITSTENTTKNAASLSKKERAKLDKEVNLFLRKSAHFTLFFLLTLFIALGTKCLKGKIRKFYVIIALLSCLAFGCIDEYHQSFTGRDAKVTDVAIDFCGGLTASVLILLINKNRNISFD